MDRAILRRISIREIFLLLRVRLHSHMAEELALPDPAGFGATSVGLNSDVLSVSLDALMCHAR
jgi:hypothetical protein